jgi:hypothetical protein
MNVDETYRNGNKKSVEIGFQMEIPDWSALGSVEVLCTDSTGIGQDVVDHETGLGESAGCSNVNGQTTEMANDDDRHSKVGGRTIAVEDFRHDWPNAQDVNEMTNGRHGSGAPRRTHGAVVTNSKSGLEPWTGSR